MFADASHMILTIVTVVLAFCGPLALLAACLIETD